MNGGGKGGRRQQMKKERQKGEGKLEKKDERGNRMKERNKI